MTAPLAPTLLDAAANPGNRRPLFDWSQVDWSSLLVNLSIAVLIVALGYWLSKWISRIVYRALTRGHVEHTLASFLKNVAHSVLMIVVFIAALQKIGVPTTSVLAIVGAAGLAVGLALKDSLSNIASGVMLITLRPFRVGDYVQAAGLEGTIEEVRIFQTRLRTSDNRAIVLPNSMITTAPILNFTANPQRRVDIVVGVDYDDDLGKARETLMALARANPRVVPEPPPAVKVDALTDSGVNIVLHAWVKTPNYADVRSELTEAVRMRSMGKGLGISFPQRNLHVFHHNADGTPLGEIAAKSLDDVGKR